MRLPKATPQKRQKPSSDIRARLVQHLQPVAMPTHPRPMLCTLVAEPFDHLAWIFEPKYDGLCVLGRFDGRDLTLLRRNHASQNFQFPDVVAALRNSLARPVIVDGEVVCLDEHGRSGFWALQQRFHLQTAREYQPKTGKTLWWQACRQASEGMIGKHLDSPYVQGRSSWWVKLKCVGRQECVIGGFTDPQRPRVGLGALLVGYYSDEGKHLIYAGKVGTGYTREGLLDLRGRLDAPEQRTSPFDARNPPRGPHVHWVRPQLVAEVALSEWTQNGLLRQPRFEDCARTKSPASAAVNGPGPTSGCGVRSQRERHRECGWHARPRPTADVF